MSKDTVLTINDRPTHSSSRAVSFSLGEPESVIAIVPGEQWRTWYNGKYYETPIDYYALAKTLRANAYHSSAIYSKLQLLVGSYIPHPWLSRADFKRWVLDRLVTGNHYLQRITSYTGETLQLKPSPAVYTRRGERADQFYFLHHNTWAHLRTDCIEEMQSEIYHLLDPDMIQEIYGVPQYLGALNAIMLSEAAGLFRRRYFLNGNHSGYILHITDTTISDATIDQLEDQVRRSKGPGNFRSLLIHSSGGDKEGIKLIPVGNTKTEDDFGAIKNISHEEITVAHRVPPQMMAITPKHGSAGLGDARTAAENYMDLEIAPLQDELRELNELVGEEVIRFKPFMHHTSPRPDTPNK